MPARARIIGLWFACSSSLACGAGPAPAPQAPRPLVAAPAPAAPAASAAPAAGPVSASSPEPEPQESPGFAETLARLRPAGTEAALAALAAAPSEPERYAQAALAFANTDAPAMTLIWGMTYQAMGGGTSNAAVADALAKVLRERVVAVHDEQTHQLSFNVRLAPGQMPARKAADGSLQAPIAHVFEMSFSPALTGMRPPWTIEQFDDALSSWLGEVAAHGTPLDQRLELDGWLVTLAKAGHLEAYCHALLGSAFPPELKQYQRQNAAKLKAYQAYLKATPLRPAAPPMPDDLVRIR